MFCFDILQQAYNAIAVSRQMKLMVLNSTSNNNKASSSAKTSSTSPSSTASAAGTTAEKRSSPVKTAQQKSPVEAEVRKRFEPCHVSVLVYYTFCFWFFFLLFNSYSRMRGYIWHDFSWFFFSFFFFCIRNLSFEWSKKYVKPIWKKNSNPFDIFNADLWFHVYSKFKAFL